MQKLTMDKLRQKKIAILGFGHRTGASLANFLKKCDLAASVYDDIDESQWRARFSAEDTHSWTHLDVHLAGDKTGLEEHDLIIVSPGLPFSHPGLQIAFEKHIPVVSELEFASWFIKAKTIMVTGTNGKSSTTHFIDEMLKNLNFKTFVGGNFGVPLIEAVDKDIDVAIVEVSTFQMEASYTLKPNIGVLLNVTDNHLDRHFDLTTYGGLKKRLFQRMDESDIAILGADCPWVAKNMTDIGCTKRWFSRHNPTVDGYINETNWCFELKTTPLSLRGPKSIDLMTVQSENFLAALMTVEAYCDEKLDVSRLLKTLSPLPHRMENIGTKNGRTFINDSKSTTLASTKAAIESLSCPCVLILGGRYKSPDTLHLKQWLNQKNVHQTIVYGEMGRILETSKPGGPVVAPKFADALFQAYKRSRRGDSILLSPAGSSLDQFSSYEQRGQAFKDFFQRIETSQQMVGKA